MSDYPPEYDDDFCVCPPEQQIRQTTEWQECPTCGGSVPPKAWFDIAPPDEHEPTDEDIEAMYEAWKRDHPEEMPA